MIHKSKSGVVTLYTSKIGDDLSKDLVELSKGYLNVVNIKSTEDEDYLFLYFNCTSKDNPDYEQLEQIEFDLFKLYHDMKICSTRGTYSWIHIFDSISINSRDITIKIGLRKDDPNIFMTYLDIIPIDILIKIGGVIRRDTRPKPKPGPRMRLGSGFISLNLAVSSNEPSDYSSINNYFYGIDGISKGLKITDDGKIIR